MNLKIVGAAMSHGANVEIVGAGQPWLIDDTGPCLDREVMNEDGRKLADMLYKVLPEGTLDAFMANILKRYHGNMKMGGDRDLMNDLRRYFNQKRGEE